MTVLKLYDENRALTELKTDTIKLIRGCQIIEPIKKLVESHDILELTLEINQKFPTTPPDLPVCDEGALIHLKMVIRELFVYHRLDLPNPEFYHYCEKILRLLNWYQIPTRF